VCDVCGDAAFNQALYLWRMIGATREDILQYFKGPTPPAVVEASVPRSAAEHQTIEGRSRGDFLSFHRGWFVGWVSTPSILEPWWHFLNGFGWSWRLTSASTEQHCGLAVSPVADDCVPISAGRLLRRAP